MKPTLLSVYYIARIPVRNGDLREFLITVVQNYLV